MISLFSFELSVADLVIFFLVAILIGMSKTGIHGTGTMAVPLLASVFGGQLSSGIMLPIICMADIMGVLYYHRHAEWKYLRKLFPWAILGTILGTIVGKSMPDDVFRMIMAVIIILSVIIMIWLERGRKEDVPDSPWFAGLAGTTGGFTSMVGNLAGSLMAVYFLSMRLPKNVFIGTTAWFFMVMNWSKVPFHVFSWHTITWNTLLLDVITLPAIALGAYIGIVLVKYLKDKTYRWFIMGVTVLAAVLMLLR
ncbi:sulfite exporter TauE/SafE family protein [Dawidia soli]|uniref:Probable membrane transporter protein n=1 Tax=Dawidia soli TaxID=2782352 RepID=A0AAP2D755_9BACT|nr:sulfite exporter TauE/SafE family protein [Dawidia soli]MBT1685260.1 sulfite exporter TauE/SafE family protein [Dawidia soli]